MLTRSRFSGYLFILYVLVSERGVSNKRRGCCIVRFRTYMRALTYVAAVCLHRMTNATDVGEHMIAFAFHFRASGFNC